jgi:hypothetical protein
MVTAAQKAYGCLWRDMRSDSLFVKEARHQLRDALTLDERRAAVQWAFETFGEPTDVEVGAFAMPH